MKSKRLFYLFTVVFIIFIGYISFDFAKKTTFPGSKPQLRERLKEQYKEADTVRMDSIRSVRP